MLYLPKVSPRQSSRTTVHTPVHFGLQPVYSTHLNAAGVGRRSQALGCVLRLQRRI